MELRESTCSIESGHERHTQAHLQRLAGEVFIPRPASLVFGSILAGLSLLAVCAALTFGSYAPRESVSGVLVPLGGLAKVMPGKSGIVQEVLVSEGDVVASGQRLATISLERSFVQGGGAQKQMLQSLLEQRDLIEQRIDQHAAFCAAQLDRLKARENDLREERSSLAQRERTLQEKAADAMRLHEHVEKLQAQGFATVADLQQRRSQVLDTRLELETIARARSSNESNVLEVGIEMRQLPYEQAERLASLQTSLLQIGRQIAELDANTTYSIVAPVAGKITAMQVNSGTFVSTDQPVLAIVRDEQPLVAEILVPSRAMGLLKRGTRVLLRYRAFPYEHFGTYQARISQISRTALKPNEWSTSLPGTTELTYRVFATLDRQSVSVAHESVHLQSGMLFDADIVLDKRPLWRFFFGPLLALRGRL